MLFNGRKLIFTVDELAEYVKWIFVIVKSAVNGRK